MNTNSLEQEADKYCEENKSNMEGVYNYSLLSVRNAFIAGALTNGLFNIPKDILDRMPPDWIGRIKRCLNELNEQTPSTTGSD